MVELLEPRTLLSGISVDVPAAKFQLQVVASNKDTSDEMFNQPSANPYSLLRGGSGTMGSLVGFPTTLNLAGGFPAQVTFTFGAATPSDSPALSLTSFDNGLSDGIAKAFYTDISGDVNTLTMYLAGQPVATGTLDSVEAMTTSSFVTTGVGQFTLTASAGADPAVYNEMVAVSGGSGQFQFQLGTFGAQSDLPYGSDAVLLTTPGSFDLQVPPVAPTVEIPTSANITNSTATLGGDLTTGGGSTVTQTGIVYSLTSVNANPQLGGTGVMSVTAVAVNGLFAANVNNLIPGANYSFEAYATNSVGTTYTSPVSTFTTVAPPVLSGIGGTTSDVAPATPITIAPNIAITDSANIASATVSFVNWQAGDRLQFSNTYALQHTFVENDAANTATLTISGTATAAQYQATLQSLQFWTVAGIPVTWVQRIATFTVNDIDMDSGSGTQNIQFNPASAIAPPALSGIGGTTSDVAPATPISFASNLVITSSVNLSSATVSFANWQPGDRLQFFNSYALQHTFVENDAANTATLMITGTATAAQYQTTLQSLQFWTLAGIPVTWSQRVVTFTVNDIYANSGSGTQNIQFNPVSAVAPPVLSGISGTITDNLAPATPFSFAQNLGITSSVNLSSATVVFSNGQAGDQIQFSNSYALQHTFVVNGQANTATLTLTGVASAADYQATLQSLQFWTVAGIPVTWVQRVAMFTVTDIYGNSGSATGNLQFAPASPVAPPALSGIGTTVSDTAPATPLSFAQKLVITSTVNMSSATVSFTNWQVGDRLQFANTFALQHTFVENDTTNTATLTLTGVASAAAYQTTLQSLEFSTVAGIPVTWLQRIATFTVNDIYANSGTGMQTIQFNPVSPVSPPALSGIGGLTTYVEFGSPVTVAPNLIVTDSVNVSSATISFTNWQAGDRIQFSNTFALQHAFVENLTNNTASLTITGVATAAQYQTTLQSLQFWNVAANPVTSVQRIATFTVDDIYANSGSGSQNVAVSAGVIGA